MISVRASHDAGIIIATTNNGVSPHVETFLGTNGNTLSRMFENGQLCNQFYCNRTEVALDANQFRNFNITWDLSPAVIVMKENQTNKWMSLNRQSEFTVNYFGVTTE
jgi:Farnesoic acid 0-methyl transferase